MNTLFCSRILGLWILFISVLLFAINKENEDPFYRFGPHEDLIILGYSVSTWPRYSLVVLYSLINTTLRSIHTNIIQPYIIHEIQCFKTPNNRSGYSYELIICSTMYNWFDWFIYMNLLLAQADMVLIETSTDIIANIIITYYYLKPKTTSFESEPFLYQTIHI
jgi:hypothetical protein